MAIETSSARTSAGTVLSIAPLPALTGVEADDLLAYQGATWTEVAEITNIGEFGREYNLVPHNPLGSRKTFKRKGTYNDGSFTLDMARASEGDEGQSLIVEARDSDDSYAIKVELQDGTGTFYMPVQVMSARTSVGGADDITGMPVSLEIDGNVLEDTGTAPAA